MKRTILFIAAATALLFTTSCQKEEPVQSFTAQLENSNSDAKTVLNGTYINWVYGSDEVEIYDADDNHSTFIAQQYSSSNTNATKAKLVNTSNTLSNTSSSYKAIYPASIARSSNTIELPTVQTSSDGSLTEYPMYAQSDSKSLQFYNLCSVLKLNLKKLGESVSKIQIVTDKLSTGTFTINYNNGNPTLTASNTTDHTAVTTLQLSTPQPISSAKNFYIYLPAFSYDYMQIKVYNANGLLFFEIWQKPTNGNSMTLIRSRYHDLSFGEDDLDFHKGNVNGLFHIGPNTVATFSKGNLLQNNRNTSDYKFADKQYNHTEAGFRYRFAWGSFSATGFTEHGNDNIVNATGTWRTMSASEWEYVASSADSGRGPFITYHARAHLQVTKLEGGTVGGMILFPDQFYWPLDGSKEPPTNSFDGGTITTDWNNVTLTYEDWKVLEDAGCVFLPVTNGMLEGNMDGTGASSSVTNSGYGYYWSKTYNSDAGRAQYSYISPTQFKGAGSQNQVTRTNSKMSHRLVRVIQQSNNNMK